MQSKALFLRLRLESMNSVRFSHGFTDTARKVDL